LPKYNLTEEELDDISGEIQMGWKNNEEILRKLQPPPPPPSKESIMNEELKLSALYGSNNTADKIVERGVGPIKSASAVKVSSGSVMYMTN
jgi:hypothetical protein